MFWYEPQTLTGTFSYSPALPDATTISWDIPYLAPGESVVVDLFVQYADASTGSSGSSICNIGNVEVTAGDVADSNPGNNAEMSCLVDQMCSVSKQCQGYIYATGITITQSSNTLAMTGICIVEATCGYSDTFSETSA